ncbi:hypothetical protein K435DRAFT_850649 [Dendrothele bispora CBS 962.96]|uniref:Uncharacterized protein n=1 Tax=Dendrothele bispora (strain CBS 962.96) TaxID=1314807 RepID=A0A4S8MPA7_DENBC|nr:hypothetical protein K435DRAFT_850649 [Dendrothele bispora CBS 962.96]
MCQLGIESRSGRSKNDDGAAKFSGFNREEAGCSSLISQLSGRSTLATATASNTPPWVPNALLLVRFDFQEHHYFLVTRFDHSEIYFTQRKDDHYSGAWGGDLDDVDVLYAPSYDLLPSLPQV